MYKLAILSATAAAASLPQLKPNTTTPNSWLYSLGLAATGNSAPRNRHLRGTPSQTAWDSLKDIKTFLP